MTTAPQDSPEGRAGPTGPERGLLLLAGVMAAWWLWQYWLDARVHLGPGFVSAWGEQLGRDFINAWATPRMAWAGRAAAAWSVHDLNVFERGLTAPNAEAKVFFYPPIDVLLTAPFALAPFLTAYAAWTLLGVAAPAALMAPRVGWTAAVVLVLAAPATFLNAISGQNGAYTVLFLGGGLMLLDRRPLLAGVLLGLMAYKPQLALMIPFALLAGGRWRAILAGCATGAVLAAVSLVWLGPGAWLAFLHDGPQRQQLLSVWTYWRRMETVYTTARLLGAGNAAAYAAQGVSAVGAAVLVVLVWRARRVPPAIRNGALLVATFLATPYAWDYDTLVLIPAAVWICSEARAGGWLRAAFAPLAGAVLIPGLVMFVPARAYHLQLECLFLWWLLLLLGRRALRGDATLSPPAAISLSLRPVIR